VGFINSERIRHFANQWGWVILLAASLLPLLWTGLHQDIMEVDSAQYASMSREMLQGASRTELTEHGQRYQSRGFPDKPPLVFWAGALGMKFLGPTEAGFRLISWLAAALAVWAVGNWARLLWGSGVAGPTRWVYATNIGMLLMNVDLRTDSLLLSFTTLALWLGHSFMLRRGIVALLGFTVALALGLMAKGPIAAVAVLTGLLPAWPAVERARKSWVLSEHQRTGTVVGVFPALLVVVVGVFLLLSPMLWGLYRQWGWQDGVRYYLWTQSFGRITGENPWANQPGPLFLTGSLAWSFLPWTPVLLASVYYATKSLLVEKWNYAGIGALMGLILLIMALSSSAYQLPHYIYIVWPFAAVLCGRLLSEARLNSYLQWGQNAILVLLLAACAVLVALISLRPLVSLGLGTAWLLTAAFIIRSRFKGNQSLIAKGVLIFVVVSATLLAVFYPNVLPFQAGARAAQTYRSLQPADPLWILGCRDESLHNMHFYSGSIVSAAEKPIHLPASAAWVYTDPEGRAQLKRSGRMCDTLYVFPFTRVSTLKPDFFHPKKREKLLENRYLIHIQPIFAPVYP